MRLDDIPAKAAKSAVFARRAKFLDLAFAIDVDTARTVLHVADGRVALAADRAPAFTLAAPAAAWAEFASPAPRPGFQDISAMIETANATIAGDLFAFLRNLFLVKEVLGMAREVRP